MIVTTSDNRLGFTIVAFVLFLGVLMIAGVSV